MLSRRGFLSVTAVATVGTVAVVREAGAFSIETAEPPLAAEYLAARDACPARGDDHAQQLAQAVEQLAQRPLTAADRAAVLARLTCPLCGCRLSDG